MNIKKITGKEVKDAVEWLWSNRKNGGCYHFAVFTDEDGTEFDIVIGWSDYGALDDNDLYYCDEGHLISWKVGVQSPLNGMQTDFDIDFDYPEDKDGSIIGWREPIVRLESEAGFNEEAEDMNKGVVLVFRKLKLIGGNEQ